MSNFANDIPVSIWYEDNDGGSDPQNSEHRFGVYRYHLIFHVLLFCIIFDGS